MNNSSAGDSILFKRSSNSSNITPDYLEPKTPLLKEKQEKFLKYFDQNQYSMRMEVSEVEFESRSQRSSLPKGPHQNESNPSLNSSSKKPNEDEEGKNSTQFSNN
mmetsp:Transcript_21796/g.20928  ORF Transcript_21796/g.20928 Transcript_21796/m.20928 type:complete len:105 (+) Transcript_21796:1979-2293(+)